MNTGWSRYQPVFSSRYTSKNDTFVKCYKIKCFKITLYKISTFSLVHAKRLKTAQRGSWSFQTNGYNDQ